MSGSRHFSMGMEKGKCCTYTQKMTNSVLKNNGLFHFSQYAVKFLNALFMTVCYRIC